MQKDWLYVGHYIDKEGNYLLKIGTTNDLDRRKKEHTRTYRKATKFTMPANEEFIYDWFIALSKYNTLRYEDKNRQAWQTAGIGEFVRNDRFLCAKRPRSVQVKIRKIYQIELA